MTPNERRKPSHNLDVKIKLEMNASLLIATKRKKNGKKYKTEIIQNFFFIIKNQQQNEE